MQIELEKKYNLTKNDYKIIKENCEFKENVNLKDYYLDSDFILTKNNYYLRLRNWIYELKISKFDEKTKMVSSEEYDDEDEINEKLKKFNISIDDCSWIIFVDTTREKYSYNYNWTIISIDVEEYQYGTRYELELVYNQENEDKTRKEIEQELNKTLDEVIKKLWLKAESNINSSKIITCAMYQNIEMYEILAKTEY